MLVLCHRNYIPVFAETPHIHTQALLYDVIHHTSQAKNKEGKTESLAQRKYNKYSKEQWKWEQ